MGCEIAILITTPLTGSRSQEDNIRIDQGFCLINVEISSSVSTSHCHVFPCIRIINLKCFIKVNLRGNISLNDRL